MLFSYFGTNERRLRGVGVANGEIARRMVWSICSAVTSFNVVKFIAWILFWCFSGKMSFSVCDDGSVEELFEGLACGEVEVLGISSFLLMIPEILQIRFQFSLKPDIFLRSSIHQVQIQIIKQLLLLQFPPLQPLILHRQVLLQGLPHLRQVLLQLLYQTLIQQLKRWMKLSSVCITIWWSYWKRLVSKMFVACFKEIQWILFYSHLVQKMLLVQSARRIFPTNNIWGITSGVFISRKHLTTAKSAKNISLMLQASMFIQRLMILHSWSSNVQFVARGFCQNPSWMSICHLIVKKNCMCVSFVRPRVTSILKEQGNMRKLAVRIPKLKVLLYVGFVARNTKTKGEERDTWKMSMMMLQQRFELSMTFGRNARRQSGDWAAIGLLCGDVIRRIFSSFPKHPWTLLSQSRGDCAGTGELCGDGPIAALRTFYFKLFYCASSSCILWCSWVLFTILMYYLTVFEVAPLHNMFVSL